MKTDDVQLRPVTLDDFRSMEIDWSNHIDHKSPTYWECAVQAAATAGLFVNSKLMIFLGLIDSGDGVSTMFVVSSIHVLELRIQRLILKYANTAMRLLQGVYRPHRLQAIVCPTNQQHISFIEHFGFVYEATLKDFTPAGADVFLYAKSVRV